MNTQILDEAADWLIELDAGDLDAATRQRFDTWLRTSPEHVHAYLELLPGWEAGTSLPTDKTLTIEDLIAMGQGASGNVLPLEAPASRLAQDLAEGHPVGTQDDKPRSTPIKKRAQRTRPLAIAATLLISCLLGGVYLYAQRGVYATGVGEQRTVKLEDGSTVNLNAMSKVRIHFTDTRRNIDLLTGQALFKVAHDTTRPFIVAADKTRVRAVGTQFDVYRKPSGTTITVLEGKVAVAASSTAASSPPVPEIPVVAGEQLTLTPIVVAKPKAANVANATAWTQGRLVFDDSTLRDVIDEFNRYNIRRLKLSDPTLENLPITAAFSSADPTPLIRFLKAQPGIRVEETPKEILITRD